VLRFKIKKSTCLNLVLASFSERQKYLQKKQKLFINAMREFKEVTTSTTPGKTSIKKWIYVLPANLTIYSISQLNVKPVAVNFEIKI